MPIALTLFFNTYLIDFFALSRGYALSIGFSTLSLQSYLASFNKLETKAFTYACKAILADFSLLYYLVVLSTIHLFVLVQNWVQTKDIKRIFLNQKVALAFILFALSIISMPIY